ncbi:hypothetical protein RJI07_07430 [Mycoplasmatota bacterium WC30]
MKEGSAKKYFKKINTTFEGVNRQDEFAKVFLNVIESAETELYQRERRERRVFDDSWMDAVEHIIPVIDKLTRNPREMLKKVSLVVPVERAKKIDADTIRHLAANTQFIKKAEKNGNIIPSKVLTNYSDSDLGTYENRFLMTLVNKLYIFIELRYNLIVEKSKTEYVNYLKVHSALKWDEKLIDYDITLRIHEDTSADEMAKKNQELLRRITEMRAAITNYKMSSFMKQMQGFIPVRPPIIKTNIILKNFDYSSCYDMWILIDQVDRMGFDVDVFERDVEFHDKYLEQIQNVMMVLYATITNNQIEDFSQSLDIPFNYRKRKNPKILQTYVKDQYIEPGDYTFEDNSLNQYFLDQIRKNNDQRYKTLIDAGITEEESIKIIYERLAAIADAAFVDFMNENYKPDDEKDLEDKIKVQNKVLGIYRSIDLIKKDDIKKLGTQKSLAQLTLNNFREELKKEKADKRLQKQIAKAEAQKREMDIKRIETAKAIENKKRLEKAKKVLEDADKERREKKIRKLREYS